jgi:hypothetical protein
VLVFACVDAGYVMLGFDAGARCRRTVGSGDLVARRQMTVRYPCASAAIAAPDVNTTRVSYISQHVVSRRSNGSAPVDLTRRRARTAAQCRDARLCSSSIVAAFGLSINASGIGGVAASSPVAQSPYRAFDCHILTMTTIDVLRREDRCGGVQSDVQLESTTQPVRQ